MKIFSGQSMFKLGGGLLLGVLLGGIATFHLTVRWSEDLSLRDHLMVVIEATGPLLAGEGEAAAVDETMEKLLVRSIQESERLTGRGARLEEPWRSVYPFARQVEDLVAARGLDPAIAAQFWLVAERLVEHAA